MNFLHMRNYVLNICLRYYVALKDKTKSSITNILGYMVKFTGAASSVPVVLDNEIEINTTVDPNSHTHSTLTSVAGVTSGSANTIAQREANSALRSSGNKSVGLSGFKLANGTDISTLFKYTTDYDVQGIQHIDSGGGNRLVDIWISFNNSNKILTVNRSFANDCYYECNCRCNCCC